jgi:hypothetical protein
MSFAPLLTIFFVAHHEQKSMEPISVEKKIGERECRVTFYQGITPQCELNIHYQHKGETWIASKKGSPEEIAEFIELAVPNIPDTKLINSALEELSRKMPEGILVSKTPHQQAAIHMDSSE